MSAGNWRTQAFVAIALLSMAWAVGYAVYVGRQRQSGPAPAAAASAVAEQANGAASAAGPESEASSGTKAAASRGAEASEPAPTPAGVPPPPTVRPLLIFRANTTGPDYGKLAMAHLDAPGRRTYSSTMACERVHYANGRGVCLRADRGVFTTYVAVAFDRDLQPGWTLPLHGLPSRVRMSPSGALAAMTVFLSGHSYTSLDLATETSIVDAATGRVITDLEQFSVTRDGAPFESADFNYWGVTFTRDENRFYATLWTGGKTHLVEATLSDRTARVIREGVECPSLSPDNTRIAFKHKTGPITWNLHLLDLRTMEETELGETRSVDDQVEWLDNATLVYALTDTPGGSSPSTDLWAMPARPGGTPRLLTTGAYSPAVTR